MIRNTQRLLVWLAATAVGSQLAQYAAAPARSVARSWRVELGCVGLLYARQRGDKIDALLSTMHGKAWESDPHPALSFSILAVA